jgi:hypothetical protein
MLYVAQRGGNFVEKATLATDIVYVVCSLKDIVDSEIVYYFTDGHATDNLTTFYNYEKIDDLETILDWTAIKSSYWSGNENLNLKRKKQAEFLIQNDLNSKFISRFGCFNKSAKAQLQEMGIEADKIKEIPQAYF